MAVEVGVQRQTSEPSDCGGRQRRAELEQCCGGHAWGRPSPSSQYSVRPVQRFGCLWTHLPPSSGRALTRESWLQEGTPPKRVTVDIRVVTHIRVGAEGDSFSPEPSS